MSLASNVVTFATRAATEFKTIRTMITGSGTGDLTGLTTTAKTSVVAAVNDARVKAERVMQERMASVTKGLPLPPGMKLF